MQAATAPQAGVHPWHDGARTLVRAATAVVTAAVVASQLDSVLELLRARPEALLPVTLQAVVLLGAAAALWSDRRHWQVRAGIGGTWLVSGLALAATDPASSLAELWWPLQTLYLVGPYLAVSSRRPGETLTVLGALLAVPLVLTPLRPDLPPEVGIRHAIASGISLAAVAAAAVLVSRGLRLTMSAADRVSAVRHDRERAALQHEATRRAVAASGRYVHDTVLHGLQVLAMDRVDVGETVVHAQIAQLREALTDAPLLTGVPAPAGRTLVELLEEVVPPGLIVSIASPADLEVPTHVQEAMARAAGEAMRNVAQHAGTAQAKLKVRRSGSGIEVVVRDKGAGFDVAAAEVRSFVHGRRGLRHSVHERMAAVGGSAEVRSTPGRGTSVVLRWGVPVARHGDLQWPWQPETLQVLLHTCVLVLVPVVVSVLAKTFVLWPYLAHPEVALPVVIATVTVTVAGFAFVRLGCHPVVGAGLALVAVVIAAVAPRAGDLATGPGVVELGAGTLAIILYLLALFRHRVEAVLVGAVVIPVLVVATTQSGAAHPTGDLMLLMVAATFGLAAGLTVRGSLGRVGRQASLADEVATHAQLTAALEAETRRQVRERLLAVSGAVQPLVEGVAEGRLDPNDPQVRDQAADVERLLREDLQLGGSPKVRSALAKLRAEGVRVTTRCPSELPEWARADLAGLIRLVTRAVRAHERLPGRDVQIVLLPAPDESERRLDLSVLISPPLSIDIDRWEGDPIDIYQEEGSVQLMTSVRGQDAG